MSKKEQDIESVEYQEALLGGRVGSEVGALGEREEPAAIRLAVLKRFSAATRTSLHARTTGRTGHRQGSAHSVTDLARSTDN